MHLVLTQPQIDSHNELLPMQSAPLGTRPTPPKRLAPPVCASACVQPFVRAGHADLGLDVYASTRWHGAKKGSFCLPWWWATSRAVLRTMCAALTACARPKLFVVLPLRVELWKSEIGNANTRTFRFGRALFPSLRFVFTPFYGSVRWSF